MIAVFERAELGDTLTAIERAELTRLALTGPRAREWIAGRAALHRLLGSRTSVVSDADGAPRVVDDRRHVSLSHDGAWVAVAVRAAPVAIDLCAASHRPRVARILARLGIASEDPTLAWAALECALKLRHRGVWTLLDGSLAVRDDADGAWVEGIGAPVRVAWRSGPAYALAWTESAAPAWGSAADRDAPTWGAAAANGVGP